MAARDRLVVESLELCQGRHGTDRPGGAHANGEQPRLPRCRELTSLQPCLGNVRQVVLRPRGSGSSKSRLSAALFVMSSDRRLGVPRTRTPRPPTHTLPERVRDSPIDLALQLGTAEIPIDVAEHAGRANLPDAQLADLPRAPARDSRDPDRRG